MAGGAFVGAILGTLVARGGVGCGITPAKAAVDVGCVELVHREMPQLRLGVALALCVVDDGDAVTVDAQVANAERAAKAVQQARDLVDMLRGDGGAGQ
jgi:hypothetical protein